MAKSAAPLVSPTNKIPSGPKVNGPADFRSGLPFLRLAVGSAPRAMAAVRNPAITVIAAMPIPRLDIAGSPSLLNPSILMDVRRFPPDPDYRRVASGINEPVWESSAAGRGNSEL